MDYVQMPSDFQLNKLMFFKDMSYSEKTKKMYWSQYLNFIADIEVKYDKDLYELNDTEIQEYKNAIKNKSKSTIDSTNSFIKKYMEWYSKHYKLPRKNFELKNETKQDGSWYINKKDFFKMCNKMLKVTSIYNIIPLLFARYGFMGKELLYLRNVKWEDINYKNKCITVRDEDRNIVSYISVDNDFLKWINILESYEVEKYKNKKILNQYLVKSQIEKDEIIKYTSLNSQSYSAFKSIGIERIAFSVLNNCGIVDYLASIYSDTNRPSNNNEFIQKMSVFYPKEKFGVTKMLKIKNLFAEVTGNSEILKVPTCFELSKQGAVWSPKTGLRIR